MYIIEMVVFFMAIVGFRGKIAGLWKKIVDFRKKMICGRRALRPGLMIPSE